MQLLILGMHRSGTSATSRIINMMGAYFAPPGMEIPAHADNPKGFWERKDAMAINDALLASQQCAWNKLDQWQSEQAMTASPELQQKMHGMIESLDEHEPWFLKDPRLCLTLPAWLPLLRRPAAVIVFRHPGEIALSLQTRNKLPLSYSIALWEYYAAGLLNATRKMPRVFVQHSDMIARPVKTAEALHQQLFQLGARDLNMPTVDDIRGFIDRDLYHERKETKAIPALTAEQLALADILQGLTPQTADMAVSPQSQSIIGKGIPV